MSREIVEGERFHEILRYVFLISLCEMLLISGKRKEKTECRSVSDTRAPSPGICFR